MTVSLVTNLRPRSHYIHITIHITVMSVTLCEKCHYANVNGNGNGNANGNGNVG